MEAKHTKGKWELRKTENIDSYQIRSKETNTEVCYIHNLVGSVDSEKEANAKLIAAAPEMLKELMLTYLRLQSKATKDIKFAVITDYIRASLLNKICNITGYNEQEYQYKIESISQDLRDNKIELKEAIKKATQ